MATQANKVKNKIIQIPRQADNPSPTTPYPEVRGQVDFLQSLQAQSEVDLETAAWESSGFVLLVLPQYRFAFGSLSAICFSKMESPAFLKHKIQLSSQPLSRHFLGYYLQQATEDLIFLILGILQRKERAESLGGEVKEGGRRSWSFLKAISAFL